MTTVGFNFKTPAIVEEVAASRTGRPVTLHLLVEVLQGLVTAPAEEHRYLFGSIIQPDFGDVAIEKLPRALAKRLQATVRIDGHGGLRV
jgi:hypothetical protein